MAEWSSQRVSLSTYGSWIRTLHKITTMIPHMTPVLVGSMQEADSRVIYLSCENLFYNETKLNKFTLSEVPLNEIYVLSNVFFLI